MNPSDGRLRYALVLPDGWRRIRLTETGVMHGDIDGLLNRQLHGLGEVPHIRRQLRSHLRNQAGTAREAGGIELFLSLMPAGSLSVAASLLVCSPPPDPMGENLAGLYDLLTSRYPDIPCEMVELPAGPALRRSYSHQQPASLDPPGHTAQARPRTATPETEVFGLEFHVPIPGLTPHLLALYFSSPLAALREPLTELFDAAAHTLRWSHER